MFMDMQGSKALGERQREREKKKEREKERPSLLELCRIYIAFSSRGVGHLMLMQIQGVGN